LRLSPDLELGVAAAVRADRESSEAGAVMVDCGSAGWGVGFGRDDDGPGGRVVGCGAGWGGCGGVGDGG